MPPRIREPDEPEQLVSLGWVLIDWYETYLCHGPGDLLGEPIKLDDERAAHIVKAYELDPVTGRRVVRHDFLSRAKGWAKSELAGMIACGEALGPVRFDGWDADGDPVGRPVRDPFIRCLATEEDQPLALDTPVPTPSGWSTVGELQEGDEVFGRDGLRVPVVGRSPVRTGDPCYVVRFSDGERIVASASHEWTLERRTYWPPGRTFVYLEVTVTTAEMAGSLRDGGGTALYRVGLPQLELPEADLPVHPYLLGLWLGDGTAKSSTIAFDGQDEAEVLELLAAVIEPWETLTLLAGNVVNIRRKPRLCNWGHDWTNDVYVNPKAGDRSCRICRNKLRPGAVPRCPTLRQRLRALGVLGSKRIPVAYLRASVSQRLALLQGLMDSDGTIEEIKGRCIFTNTNAEIVDGVVELITTLGMKPSLRNPSPGVWRIGFTPSQPVFRLTRKLNKQRSPSSRARSIRRHVVAVDPVESRPVACVKVAAEDHLFLVGRRMVPTHNTGNTYGNVTIMLQHADEVGAGDFPRIDIGNDPATSTRTFIEGGGEIRPSTSGDASKDGGLETFSVADETHLYITQVLRSMYSTVARNGTKRKIAEPWRLDTSTMYQPGQGSVAEDTHTYWKQIQAGLIKNRGLLFDHRQGPMPKNWDDDEEMVRCLKVAYGAAAPWTDFEAKLADIRDPRTTRSATCRYYLNRPEKGEEMWVEPDLFDMLVRPGPPPPDGVAVALGFDGSESDDNTALIGVEMATGRVFVVDIWGRGPGDGEKWQVPRPKVQAVVADTFRRYQVAKMLCDPPYWRSEIAEWQARFGEKVVEEFATKQWSKMAEAVEGLDSAMRAQPPGVTFDGNPVLRQHFLNAHKEPVNRTRPQAGFVLVKDRHGSPDKIDGAVAAVLANEARDQAVAAGWKPPAKAFAFVLK